MSCLRRASPNEGVPFRYNKQHYMAVAVSDLFDSQRRRHGVCVAPRSAAREAAAARVMCSADQPDEPTGPSCCELLSYVDQGLAESEAPPDANEGGDSHVKPDSTDDPGGIIDPIEIATEPSVNIPDAHNHHHRFFFSVVTAMSIGGMGVAGFGVLAGGKVGYALPKEMFESMAFGVVDTSVNLDAIQQATPAKVKSRGAGWLASGFLLGSCSAGSVVSFETKRWGAIWQP